MSLISTDNALLLAGDSFVSEAVADVKVNGNSIIEDGVADIPVIETDVVAMASNLNTSTDNSIPTSKAVRDYTAEQSKEKLSKPSSGIAVGKYFRVASIDDAGNPVLEAVDLPNVLVNASVGTQVYSNSTGTYIATRCATDAEIESRDNNRYKPIPVARLRTAVDSVLCSTDVNEALTETQKVGFWNRVEKQWVLKATITTANKGGNIAVDMSNCTEICLVGSYKTNTGTFTIRTQTSAYLIGLSNSSSGTRYMSAAAENGVKGIKWKYARYGNNLTAIGTNASMYDWANNQYVSNITSLNILHPEYIEEINIEVYAR